MGRISGGLAMREPYGAIPPWTGGGAPIATDGGGGTLEDCGPKFGLATRLGGKG